VAPAETLTLSADFTQTRWSKGRIRGFFDLDPTGPTGSDGVPATPPPPKVLPELQYPTLEPVPEPGDTLAERSSQNDKQEFRLGLEWVLIAGASGSRCARILQRPPDRTERLGREPPLQWIHGRCGRRHRLADARRRVRLRVWRVFESVDLSGETEATLNRPRPFATPSGRTASSLRSSIASLAGPEWPVETTPGARATRRPGLALGRVTAPERAAYHWLHVGPTARTRRGAEPGDPRPRRRAPACRTAAGGCGAGPRRALARRWLRAPPVRGGLAGAPLGPIGPLLAVLADRSDRAKALRQCSPFAGVVDPRTRWKLWREVRERMRV